MFWQSNNSSLSAYSKEIRPSNAAKIAERKMRVKERKKKMSRMTKTKLKTSLNLRLCDESLRARARRVRQEHAAAVATFKQ